MSITLIVNIIAIVNVFIIFTLLFFRRENALPNKILAIAFLIPGLYFLNTIFILLDFLKLVPISLFFVQTIAVFFPIMIFYYFNLLTGKGFPKSKFLFIGSGVLLIYILGLAVRFAFFTMEEKTAYLISLSNDNYPTDLFLYTVFFYAWQLVYFTVITRKINRYKKQLDDTISNQEQFQYVYMVRFIILLWTFNAILVGLYVSLPLYLVDYIYLPIGVNLLYFFLLFFTYHHNAVFTSVTFHQLKVVNEVVGEEDNLQEYHGFVPTEKHLYVFEKLKQLIEKDKIYIDSDLSVRTISNKIDAPEYIVSQSINHYFQKSFFDLINESRIKEAKIRLLKMAPTETIEGIGYDVGFNSRSSFYRVFRKHVGKTPKQFIEGSK